MGHSHGIVWTPELLRTIRNWRFDGMPAGQIVQRLSDDYHVQTTYDAVIAKMNRLSPAAIAALDDESPVPSYDKEIRLPAGDYIVACDYHSPYYSIPWHNRTMAVAERFGIRKIIIVGDLVDFGFASFFYSENRPSLDEEKDENKRLLASLIGYFDEIILIKGNHEDRLGRMTDGKVQADVLLELWTKDAWQKKVRYSTYDKLFIGDEWMLVHPKNYSTISGQVAKKLATKFHRNIINAHGHFLSYGYDISGKFLCVDMGGLFDTKKIEYSSIKTTTHPNWQNGFGALWNGHFYFFDERTDWNFWLGGGEDGRSESQRRKQEVEQVGPAQAATV